MIYDQNLESYLNQHSSTLTPLLDELERETHLKTLSPQMLSGKVQGVFLKMIAKLVNPMSILEIGTFTGYATLCLAEGLREGGKIHTIESNPEIVYIARKYFDLSPHVNNIKLHIGNAMEIIPMLDEKFDLVFIDADKENYLQYYYLVMPKMRSGGVIIADNVLWSGKVLEDKMDKKTKALHEFNVAVSQDERVENMILPLRDGLHYIRIK